MTELVHDWKDMPANTGTCCVKRNNNVPKYKKVFFKK